jgi:hypothetical protein
VLELLIMQELRKTRRNVQRVQVRCEKTPTLTPLLHSRDEVVFPQPGRVIILMCERPETCSHRNGRG